METLSAFYFVFVSRKKFIKIRQAFKNIQQLRTSRYFGEIFKFQWKSGACATNFQDVCLVISRVELIRKDKEKFPTRGKFRLLENGLYINCELRMRGFAVF
jgi:hypothetical protein